MKKIKNNRNKFKPIFLITLVGVLIIALLAILEVTNVINIISGSQNEKDLPQTTSKEPSAQSDFKDGDQREVIQSNKNEGTVVDTKGSVTSTSPQAEWTSSPSGVVTVYSPAKNSLLNSGQSITGKSNATRISFRLIDDVSGVISQGSIGVVNEKFSGKFDFTTTATNGRLDIFTADVDGVESNSIEIPVRFK